MLMLLHMGVDLREGRSKLEKDLLSVEPSMPPALKEPMDKTPATVRYGMLCVEV